MKLNTSNLIDSSSDVTIQNQYLAELIQQYKHKKISELESVKNKILQKHSIYDADLSIVKQQNIDLRLKELNLSKQHLDIQKLDLFATKFYAIVKKKTKQIALGIGSLFSVQLSRFHELYCQVFHKIDLNKQIIEEEDQVEQSYEETVNKKKYIPKEDVNNSKNQKKQIQSNKKSKKKVSKNQKKNAKNSIQQPPENIILICRISQSDLVEGRYKRSLHPLNIDIVRQIIAVKSMDKNIPEEILNHIFFPSQYKKLKNYTDKLKYKQYSSHKLNEYQLQAMANIINQPITLIKGPPGTGKTFLINQIVAYYIKLHKKILITAPSNYSVDNSAKLIYSESTQNIVRIYSNNQQKFNQRQSFGRQIQKISLKQKIIKKILDRGINLEFFSQIFKTIAQKFINCFQNKSFDSILSEYHDWIYYSLKQRVKYISSLDIGGNCEFPHESFKQIYNKIKKQFYINKQTQLLNKKSVLKRLIQEVSNCFTFKIFIQITGKNLLEVFNLKQHHAPNFMHNKNKFYYLVFIPRFEEWLLSSEKSFVFFQVASHQNIRELKFIYSQQIIDQSDVVCCTCVTSGSSLLKKFDFQIVIVDESAQASQVTTLIPLCFNPQKVILLGDTRQLTPIFNIKLQKDSTLHQSLFNRLVIRQKHDFIILKIQYRMNLTISRFINNTFYDGILKNGNKIKELQPQDFPNFKWKDPIMIINISRKKGKEKVEGSSFVNYGQIIEIKKIISKFPKTEYPNIGIITGYKAQEEALKTQLKQQSKMDGLEIRCIDGYQGNQKDYIIISIVRSNRQYDIGFIQKEQRINVCMSRARKGIIIVGNVECLRNNEIWKNLVQDYYDDE